MEVKDGFCSAPVPSRIGFAIRDADIGDDREKMLDRGEAWADAGWAARILSHEEKAAWSRAWAACRALRACLI